MALPRFCENINRIPTQQDINEALTHAAILCQYAYNMGYHEMGYDPVEVLRAASHPGKVPTSG